MDEENHKPHVRMYLKGHANPNPGKGGFAALLYYAGTDKHVSGFEPNVSAHCMEIQAAIAGLRLLKMPCVLTIYSNNLVWVKSAESLLWNGVIPPNHRGLWLQWVELARRHEIIVEHVRKVDNDAFMRRVDMLALQQCRGANHVQR